MLGEGVAGGKGCFVKPGRHGLDFEGNALSTMVGVESVTSAGNDGDGGRFGIVPLYLSREVVGVEAFHHALELIM